MFFNRFKKEKSGYMLIEILVSLAIFTLIAVSTTAALLTLIDANAKSQSIKLVMDNLSVAVENMSRAIRIGTDYKCADGPDDPGSYDKLTCQGGTSGFSFLPQDAEDENDRMYYYFQIDLDANGNSHGAIYRSKDNVETVLTAPEVDISSLEFYLIGADTNDGQPRVLISINGRGGLTEIAQTSFIIQTTVAERKPDCDDSSSCTR